jgi:ferredoxin-NADP reductase
MGKISWVRQKYPSNEKLWYVCGPPSMVGQLEKVLQEIGVPDDKLRIENWQIPEKDGL